MRLRKLLFTLLGASLWAAGCTDVLGINEDYRLDDDADGGSGGSGAATTGPGANGGAGGLAEGCDDGRKNNSETDVDCGGDCPDCGLGRDCGSNADCQSGDCFMNTCVDRGQVGDDCNGGADCQSGFCVDDVCCSERCDATCNACSQALTQMPDGTCGLTVGSDPHAECMTGEVCIEGNCGVCGGSPTPANTTCPAECTGGCLNNFQTCVIDCSGGCPSTVSCPTSYDCVVNCTGQNACSNSTINCPADYDCSVVCEQGNGCRSATIACNSGPCSLTCNAGNNACQQTVLDCDSQQCTRSCNGASDSPTQNCGSACDCVNNGC